MASTTRKRGRPRHSDVLTPAEWRIVHAVRHGMTNREIARHRGISVDAVKFHVENAVGKLGLESRAELKRWQGAPVDSAIQGRERMTSSPFALGPVGQISREVSDLERAVEWYRDVLRLPLLGHYGNLAMFDMAGIRLFLSHHAGGNASGNSLIYFAVEDISDAYAELKSRGITFRGAPHLVHRHPDGTEEWMAFFEDFDGGVLALMSRVRV
jgi:DNA-binding CsgD family transcriptional regulator/catechol 2,3-dioxygenase-like lactoylglutathione lyase family enzyme